MPGTSTSDALKWVGYASISSRYSGDSAASASTASNEWTAGVGAAVPLDEPCLFKVVLDGSWFVDQAANRFRGSQSMRTRPRPKTTASGQSASVATSGALLPAFDRCGRRWAELWGTVTDWVPPGQAPTRDLGRE